MTEYEIERSEISESECLHSPSVVNAGASAPVMTEYEKLHSGDIYNPGDEAIFRDQLNCLEKQYDFNLTRPHELDKRAQMLGEMFAECGEGTYIEPPLHSNWGGHHTHLGKQVYANFGLTLVDDTHIYIGDYTMLGPNVVIATAAHPIDAGLRRKGLQYNKSVRIGKNCWLGAGVIVMPGVTIGDNSVIGAGSVVLEEVPPNCTVVGVPGRVVKRDNVKIPRSDMDQCHLPDPVKEDITILQRENAELVNRVLDLERQLKEVDRKVRQD